ncbi:MAG: hypothetical protein ACRDJG_01055 [Actinomycetota bacterium]
MGPFISAQLAEQEDFAMPPRYRLQMDTEFELPLELDERVLTALRAENGPIPEGRELAIVARACLAQLRRAHSAQADPIAVQMAS